MGFCLSKTSEESATSAAIERDIKRDKERQRSEVKLLLLGAGESGKSTILKQMKLIHEGGYNTDELRAFRQVIYSNLVQSMKALLIGLNKLDWQLENPENDKHAKEIRALPDQLGAHEIPSPATFKAIKLLWNDAAIQKVQFRAGHLFYLNDSAQYYLDAIDRIQEEGYLPTDQDVLRSRTKTTGIVETSFGIGDMTYRMFDVGGQRSERKKWIHCFENVTAIIFLAAISEYDSNLIEDESVNRMIEALTIFDTVCNSRWFQKTSIILFLNKTDIFKEKIERVPIEDYFPDYQGGPDYELGCQYFKERFEVLNQSTKKQIYTHFTCATDTNQMKFVMSAVHDIIIQTSLRNAGLM